MAALLVSHWLLVFEHEHEQLTLPHSLSSLSHADTAWSLASPEPSAQGVENELTDWPWHVAVQLHS